jgi:VanZ family protein
VKLPHIFLVFAWSALLFWLSSGPIDIPPSIEFNGVDKVAHVCVYAVLSGLVVYGLRRSGRSWTIRALIWIPVLYVALYGASDEFHQSFVPGRSCDFFDWLADVTGGLGAATAFSLFFCVRAKRLRNP